MNKDHKNNSEPCMFFYKAMKLFYEGKFSTASALMDKYKTTIRYDEFLYFDNREKNCMPKVSVVIVAYNTNDELLMCINSLLYKNCSDMEIIVIDNGNNEKILDALRNLDLLYIKTPMNLFLSEGRNVGVAHARSPICIFLDDDALASPGYAESALSAFAVPEVRAVRGRVLPKTREAFQGNAEHYDLGPKPMAHMIDTEGNSAWRTVAYREAGGMDPLLFGHEGTDLSIRLAKKYGEMVTFYWPAMVIYHDYAHSAEKHSIKHARHMLMGAYLRWKHGEFTL